MPEMIVDAPPLGELSAQPAEGDFDRGHGGAPSVTPCFARRATSRKCNPSDSSTTPSTDTSARDLIKRSNMLTIR